MYQCKTYQGENKRYLKSVPYSNLKHAFLNNTNYEQCFIELINFLENKNKSLLNQFMIKVMSNPHDWTIAELQELM